MRNKLCAVFICFALSTIQIQSKALRSSSDPPTQATYDPISQNPSDRVAYGILMRRVAQFETLATRTDLPDATISSLYRNIQSDFSLNDDEAERVKAIALQSLNEIKSLDNKARQIIASARAKYPGGKLNGRPRPECPQELFDLQRNKDITILNARLNINATLGESRFKTFDTRLKDLIQQSSPVKFVGK